MTAATNIQMADHGITGMYTNNKETAIMKNRTNIQGIIHINTKALAGIIAGGMMVVASILAGDSFADSPARPYSEPETTSNISSSVLNFSEMDDWVSLTYSEKLVPANALSAMNFPEVDDWVSLTYSEKLVPANAPSAMDSPEVDDWVSLTYSE